MYRLSGSLVVGLLAAAVAQGHFTFIIPEPGDAAAKVVFSDDLKPDPKVAIEKIANTKLTVRDAAGKETAVEIKKGDACYTVALPGSGPRVVYGTTEYGVMQKGDAKPFRLLYHPRALVGGAAGSAAALGTKLEIVPVRDGGKTRFRVASDGKPVPDAEITVIVPGGEKKASKTDRDGLTPAFDAAGRYGAFVRLTEAKAGDVAGRKYEEIRHYATLVADIGR